MLETIEVETAPNPTAAVIWLHGLGADGHDFEPVVPEIVRGRERAWRFVFPHAPVRPVTINGGMSMRAWYDILGFDRSAAEDLAGFRATDALVRELIGREAAAGNLARPRGARRILPRRRGDALHGTALSRALGGPDGPVLLSAAGREPGRGARAGQ